MNCFVVRTRLEHVRGSCWMSPMLAGRFALPLTAGHNIWVGLVQTLDGGPCLLMGQIFLQSNLVVSLERW